MYVQLCMILILPFLHVLSNLQFPDTTAFLLQFPQRSIDHTWHRVNPQHVAEHSHHAQSSSKNSKNSNITK